MTKDLICMENIVVLNLNALSKIFSRYIKHMDKLSPVYIIKICMWISKLIILIKHMEVNKNRSF